ncbi:MAG: DNA-directed RNA polymerase subunit omega [Firmicutes bacterium HGW-Firmicutes-11]|jgi:DNA-directed RNA polymerase subunit omega|nr:MAG: DNA-directed RNA polymerase subunit omega [Firmicutes bacterium HGW-Firmicutes-11]
MLEPSINLMKQKADSRYTLAMMAAKRARDIIEGKPSLVDIDVERPVSIAVHEIAEDLITYKRGE